MSQSTPKKATKSKKAEPVNRLVKFGIRTPYNYTFDLEKIGEKTINPSLTEPNQTMTVQQLMNRAVMQGHFPDPDKNADYLDAELDEIDKFYGQGLDLTDIDEARRFTKDLEERIDKWDADKKRVDREAEIQSEVDKRMAQAREKDERNQKFKPKQPEKGDS